MRAALLKVSILGLIALAALTYTFHTELARQYFIRRYSSNTKQPKILVLWREGVGENEEANRLNIAAKRLNIELKVASDARRQNFSEKYVSDRAYLAAHAMQPDAILIIERMVEPISGFKNYLVLDQSSDNYLGNDYAKFTGLLPTFSDYQSLSPTAQQKICFSWYPTVYKTNYTVRTPNRLFYPGGILNDDTRGSDKYRQIFSLLDKRGYLNVYGTADRWPHVVNSLQPPIPFDGISLLKEGNRAGISLILHAVDHLQHGVPTGRIFEAAASTTVIISDKNKFVQDNFADNVLYIDVNQDAAQVAAQIDAHMQWIFKHPEQATQMAQRCHEIFLVKFSLEEQLQRLVSSM